MVNNPSVHSLLGEEKLRNLSNNLLGLPNCGVWIHERQLYKLLKLSSGKYYGQRDCLTSIINGIEKGYWGNRRKPSATTGFGGIVGFASGSSSSRISFQKYGQVEQFEGGTDEVGDAKSNVLPRYFVIGKPLCGLNEQRAIVYELIGESNTLPDDIKKRRRDNFEKFYNYVTEDGGSPTIVSKYFRRVFRNCYDSTAYATTLSPQRGTFGDADMIRMEDVMRLMMVAALPRLGGISIVNGNLVPNRNSRNTRSNTNLDASQLGTEPRRRATTSLAAVSTVPTTLPNGTATPTPNSSGMLTPRELFGSNNKGGAIQLKYLDPTESGAVNWTKVQELASIELIFELVYNRDVPILDVEHQFISRGVSLPRSVSIPYLEQMSSRNMANTVMNISVAREILIESLDGCFIPQEDDLLYKWIADSRRYTRGSSVEADNFKAGTLTPETLFILRHIMYSHYLALNTVISLWASFYTLIMRSPLAVDKFVGPTTLWNNFQQMYHIDQALATTQFIERITEPTLNGFDRKIFTSSDDSNHHGQNCHVLLINCIDNDGQPSFRLLTSSVNQEKTRNANKNATLIIDTFGLLVAGRVAGGTNDNEGAAQKEIETTFNLIKQASAEADIETNEYDQVILFGDPFHKDNLAVKCASEGAFGYTEKGQNRQCHHRQLMQTFHDLHSDDPMLSQAIMDRIMLGTGKTVRIKTCRERQQRWMVNQKFAKRISEIINTKTADGQSCLLVWAITLANESSSAWIRCAAQELATWINMPSLILGLHFEAELGSYFEETMAWHNRPGPLSRRTGFRMLEIFDPLFGFQLPWWNLAIDNIDDPAKSKLPKTMQYLCDNFEDEEYNYRKAQILRGLNKGKDELVKMISRDYMKAPIILLVLTHHAQGPP